MEKKDLTKGNVSSVILMLALPIMGSSVLQFTYNLVDMIFVGGLGADAIASVGSSSFFIGLGYSINSLVVIGTGIKVAHALGEKNEVEVKKYINAGVFLNTIIAFIYALVLIFFGKYFIGFLNIDNKAVARDGYLYLALSAPMLFFAFYNLLYIKIFNSFGNNKMALKISATGIITNIILDPLFIYIFKLGVFGAALATLISNIIMFIEFRVKFNENLRYDFKLGIEKNKVKDIMSLGFPMSFQRVLFTLVNIILARIIAMFGSDAIAAQKIGLQIESVSFMIIGGLYGAISSFSGQNFGAKKYERIKEGYRHTLKIGIVYSIFTAIVFIFIPDILVKIFVRDEVTIVIASRYLQIVAFSQIFSTIEIVSNGLFTGIGMPKVPAIISIIFTILRIPMALIFINFFGLNGIWISIALSSIFKGMTAITIYRMKVSKKESF